MKRAISIVEGVYGSLPLTLLGKETTSVGDESAKLEAARRTGGGLLGGGPVRPLAP